MYLHSEDRIRDWTIELNNLPVNNVYSVFEIPIRIQPKAPIGAKTIIVFFLPIHLETDPPVKNILKKLSIIDRNNLAIAEIIWVEIRWDKLCCVGVRWVDVRWVGVRWVGVRWVGVSLKSAEIFGHVLRPSADYERTRARVHFNSSASHA